MSDASFERPSPFFRARILPGIRLLLCLAAFFAVVEIARITAGPNWHEIVPGELYRSAHLGSREIETVVHRFGIRTIINLRNACPWEPWYQDETRAVEALGLTRIDFNFSAYLPPAPEQLQKLWETLETAERPILIHCRRGADRTGLASVIAALHHYADGPPDPAYRQLSLLQGHIAFDKVREMDKVVASYRSWLGEAGRRHSRQALGRWINEEYRPGACWGEVESLSVPDEFKAGEHYLLRVRLHNRSKRAWKLDRGANVGMHLRGFIEPLSAKPPPWARATDPLPHRKHLSAGFMDVALQPGEFIDLDVAVPPLQQPGEYRLVLDVFDEQLACYGEAVGSQPFKKHVEVVGVPISRP